MIKVHENNYYRDLFFLFSLLQNVFVFFVAVATNGKVFMKDWIESTKADESSSAQNSTKVQLLPLASLS
jgi:hypothetical protein